MKLKSFLAAALPLLLLAACAKPAPAPTPTPAPVSTPAPAVTATPAPAAPVWQDQVFEGSYATDDGVPLLTARFLLPGIAGADVNGAWSTIHSYYKAEGEGYLLTADETADLAEGDYDVQTSLGYDFTPYALESYYSVVLQSDTLISVRRTYYSDIDAGDPALFQFSEQFDAATGAKLDFADFFSDPAAAKAHLLEAVRTQIGSREDGDSFDLTRVESSFREDGFYLTQDSVVVYYQPGTLAPHAMGVAEFSVLLSELAGLLRR